MIGVDGVDEVDAGLFRGQRGEEGLGRGASCPEREGFSFFSTCKDSREQ